MNVSICILSFNSENTILETLQSIKDQTYPLKKIEIVLSDDCSEDNSLEVITKWKKEHINCFKNIVINRNSINLGISGNFNKSMELTSSDWIKSIGADDLLLPNCIKDNVTFVEDNSSSKIIFSKMVHFDNTNMQLKVTPDQHQRSFFNLSAEKQFNYLSFSSFNIAPTAFFLKDFILNELGGFNSEYNLIEDLPMWANITKKGVKLNFYNIETVKYRITDSISNPKETFLNINFHKQLNKVYEKEFIPHLKSSRKFILLMNIFADFLIINIINFFGNKNNRFIRGLYRTLLFFKPLHLAFKLKRFYLRFFNL